MDHCNSTFFTNVCTVGKYSLSIGPPIVQCLAGLIGNLLAIVILCKNSEKHKWKPFYRLVFALALTDSTVSIFVYPIVLKRYASDFKYCFTDYECKHVAFMYSFAFMGSALLVTSMSLDRFLAIVFPLVYYTSTKILRVTLMIATSWVFTIVLCALAIGLDGIKLYYPESWCFIDFSTHKDGDIGNIIVTYLYSSIGLFLFSVSTITNTVVIVTLIRRMIYRRKKLGARKRLKSDIYIVLFLLVIVVVFSVCWVPLISVMLLDINADCPTDGQKELLVARLAITNSIVDPWIYIVLRKENLEYAERLLVHCKNHLIKREIAPPIIDNTTADYKNEMNDRYASNLISKTRIPRRQNNLDFESDSFVNSNPDFGFDEHCQDNSEEKSKYEGNMYVYSIGIAK